MRLPRAMLLLLMVALLISALSVSAQEQPPQELRIYNVWMRPTAAQPDDEADDAADHADHADDMSMAGVVSAAYMVIENTTPTDYRLIGAEFADATLIEIHETQVENDVMRMRELEDGLLIPAGERVELRPGSFHIMIMDITRELYPDTAVALNLLFEDEAGDSITHTTAALVTDTPPAEQPIYLYNTFAAPYQDRQRPLDPLYAIYGIFANPTGRGQTLNVVETSAGALAELRQTSRSDGAQSELLEFLSAPPQARLLLQPGNIFVLIDDLPTELAVGDALIATFYFSNDITITAAVPVVDLTE